MEEFFKFLKTYRGAIIGILIAIIILIARLDRFILAVIIIVFCALAGNYVQQNKYDVKENLKKFIDRI